MFKFCTEFFNKNLEGVGSLTHRQEVNMMCEDIAKPLTLFSGFRGLPLKPKTALSRKGRGETGCVKPMKTFSPFTFHFSRFKLFRFSPIKLKKTYSPFTTHYSPIKSGFTLAEVLIVVGIIGIVAEMTIPTLIQDTKEKQYKSGAKTAYTKLSEAVRLLRLEDNSSLNAYNATTTLKPALMKYFKVAKDCNLRDCASTTTNEWPYSTLAHESMPLTQSGTQKFDDGQFVTIDGMFFMIENCTSFPATNLMISVDVNGYEKGPNVLGRDVYAFQIVNDSLLPMGALNTAYPADTYCNKNGTGQGMQGIGCMSYIMMNIDYEYK